MSLNKKMCREFFGLGKKEVKLAEMVKNEKLKEEIKCNLEMHTNEAN